MSNDNFDWDDKADENFDSSMLFVLRNEGGYANVKHDKGGATNYGISTRFLKLVNKDIDGDGHVTSKDVKSLTKDRAINLYREHFWDHYKLEMIRDVHVSYKAFDMFVNMRGSSAAKILQRACNSSGSDLSVDGILGRKSFYQINKHSRFTICKAEFLSEIRSEQAKFYRAIVKSDKTQRKFLNGWINRAMK